MSDFLDQLELSVRAGNVLRNMGGVNTIDDFMALTERQIMAQPNAGRKTWREIKELQDCLRNLPHAAPAQPLASDMSLRDAAALTALPVAWMMLDNGYYEGDNTDMVRCAFQIADAFIAAREGKTDG